MPEPPEWTTKPLPTIDDVLLEIGNPRAIEHADSGIVQGLAQMVIAHKTVWKRTRPGFLYTCMEEFVLKYGWFWEWSPWDDEQAADYDLEIGEQKACFANSFDAACHNPDGVLYVEGYAATLMTFPHAWVTLHSEPDPNMVELTLRTTEDEGSAPDDWPIPTYFGIPFDLDYVARVLKDKGEFCAIDNWRANWPLLTDPDELGKALHPDWSDA
jgi:hypothetical protein